MSSMYEFETLVPELTQWDEVTSTPNREFKLIQMDYLVHMAIPNRVNESSRHLSSLRMTSFMC